MKGDLNPDSWVFCTWKGQPVRRDQPHIPGECPGSHFDLMLVDGGEPGRLVKCTHEACLRGKLPAGRDGIPPTCPTCNGDGTVFDVWCLREPQAPSRHPYQPERPVPRLQGHRQDVGAAVAVTIATVTEGDIHRTPCGDEMCFGGNRWDQVTGADDPIPRCTKDQHWIVVPSCEVVHRCPGPGTDRTPCCDTPVLELPRTDRMTIDGEVTCPLVADLLAVVEEHERIAEIRADLAELGITYAADDPTLWKPVVAAYWTTGEPIPVINWDDQKAIARLDRFVVVGAPWAMVKLYERGEDIGRRMVDLAPLNSGMSPGDSVVAVERASCRACGSISPGMLNYPCDDPTERDSFHDLPARGHAPGPWPEQMVKGTA